MTQMLIPTPRPMDPVAMPAPYIQELAHENRPGHYGFRIGGAVAGPNLVFSGFSPLAGSLFQRLLLLPSLSRLRGQLFLIQIDRVRDDSELERIDAYLPAGTVIDAQMFLPFLNPQGMDAAMIESELKEAYWSVLRLCADHGMISGRGVPPRAANEPQQVLWRSRRPH
jgi:hypothetical protein